MYVERDVPNQSQRVEVRRYPLPRVGVSMVGRVDKVGLIKSVALLPIHCSTDPFPILVLRSAPGRRRGSEGRVGYCCHCAVLVSGFSGDSRLGTL